MKSYFKGVAAQMTAIILAAAGAAIFTFFQSVATQTGVCEVPTDAVGQAGALGAMIKAGHSAFQIAHLKQLV